jgi:signal transduction histidine kinase
VKDTGKGIDHEIFPRLFSKFITTSTSTTSKFSNDGIGIELFVSKAIIEAHGGKIWAENNSDGKGATLHLAYRQLTNNKKFSNVVK